MNAELCNENGCDGRWRCATCGRERPEAFRKKSFVYYATSDGVHVDEVDDTPPALPNREELGELIWKNFPGRMLALRDCIKTADAILASCGATP